MPANMLINVPTYTMYLPILCMTVTQTIIINYILLANIFESNRIHVPR